MGFGVRWAVIALLLAAGMADRAAAAASGDRVAVVAISEEFSTRHGTPSEGFVPFLAVTGDQGPVLEQPFPRLERRGVGVRLRLAPGVVVIRRYMRVCDGNCGFLDPPTAGCALRMRLAVGHRVVLRIRATVTGCAIRRSR